MIMGIYRDWEYETFGYELLGFDLNVTEGLITFYQEKENEL